MVTQSMEEEIHQQMQLEISEKQVPCCSSSLFVRLFELQVEAASMEAERATNILMHEDEAQYIQSILAQITPYYSFALFNIVIIIHMHKCACLDTRTQPTLILDRIQISGRPRRTWFQSQETKQKTKVRSRTCKSLCIFALMRMCG
jgi:hypothetical protein